MMLGFSDFMMGIGLSCAVDPYAQYRKLFLRGDGVDGTKPTLDELGNPVTYSGNVSLSDDAGSAWPDYKTASYHTGGGIFLPNTMGSLGLNGVPFSILVRLRIWGTSGIVMQTGSANSDWGSLQNHIWLPNAGSIVWQFASPDTGQYSPSGVTIASPGGAGGIWGDGNLHELLITFDGTTTYGYYDGVLKGSVAKPYSPRGGLKTRIGMDVDGNVALNFAHNDFIIYDGVCLTTAASYTRATQAPC